MGQAKIISQVGSTAQYTIEIIKDPAKSAARLAAVVKRFAALTTLLEEADAAIALLETALNTASTALNVAIAAYKIDPAVDVATPQKALVTAMANLEKKKRASTVLVYEEYKLIKEEGMLESAMEAEQISGVWCVDKTTNLAVGAEIGTIELNGECVQTQTRICAGGLVTNSFGKVQPVGVSTPSATFVNMARCPAWQKWMPIYRPGLIVLMHYEQGTCNVAIEEAYSTVGKLRINQAGDDYPILKTAVAGWDDFAGRNPGFPLVTNTSDTQITTTQELLADLASVNSEVNNRFNYKIDTETYAKLEYWSIMQPGGSGDCEDFALTKAQMLLAKGYPPSAIHIEVGVTAAGEGHAWLVVQTTDGDIALDLNNSTPVKNESLPYYNRKRQTGMEWKANGVLKSNVPIEYMSGLNEAVFRVNDNVVIQFTDKDWSKPKVIGFLDNPKTADALFYYGQDATPFTGYARGDVDERLLHYDCSVPVGRLTGLANTNIKLLILASPIRELASAELESISTFTGRGGQIVVFNGENYTATNRVLEQLGSKLVVYSKGSDGATLQTLSGVYYGGTPAQDRVLKLPGYTRGWITVRNTGWPDAYLKDVEGFGLKYNNITNMMPQYIYVNPTDEERRWDYIYCKEIYDEINAASPPPPDIDYWDAILSQYPAGSTPSYNASTAEFKAWMLSVLGRLPFGKIAAYGAYPSSESYYFGSYYNYLTANSRNYFSYHGAGLAYAEGEQFVVCAFKPAWFHDDLAFSYAQIDQYTDVVAFMEWLKTGDRGTRDLLGQGCSYQTLPPSTPYWETSGGIPYVPPVQW